MPAYALTVPYIALHTASHTIYTQLEYISTQLRIAWNRNRQNIYRTTDNPLRETDRYHTCTAL